MPTIKDYIKNKIKKLFGLAEEERNPDLDRLTFMNNEEQLTKQRIREYNLWYEGDGDELLNFYTFNNAVEYNYEPFYSRNKRNYFWAISSTESDIKRTHSGQPRNIVDTLVSIMPFPLIGAGKSIGEGSVNAVEENLKKIIKEGKIKDIYRQEQMPLTLVEGWGCWKINWDKDMSDYPYPVYYRAENVDFIYKSGKMIGVLFRDYYNDLKNTRYMLCETRRIKLCEDGEKALVIEKELFRVSGSDDNYIQKVDFSNVPELSDTQSYIEIGPQDMLFAVPCIFYKNTARTGGYGRSIFTGKIDLFDDLDQCLSQSSNSVRKSTPVEYFNSNFLERDRNGLPIQPRAYDRKYSFYKGQVSMDGTVAGDPVQVTQPDINFQQYSDQAISILMQIMNGILSPATLGIDISKKDNAEAQREKEKITIFTRNTLVAAETEILKSLLSQLLCAYEFMCSGKITVREYDISIKYSEFADESYENKLEKLSAAFNSRNISEEMYMQKLYGDSLSEEERRRELEWLKKNHTEKEAVQEDEEDEDPFAEI